MKLPKAKKSDKDRSDYVHDVLVKQRKMKYLASGAFAQVYGRKDHDRVVKVGWSHDNYLQYVKLVGLKNPNPHLPKIYSVQMFKPTKEGWGSDTYYVVEMERLIPYGKVPRRNPAHKRYQMQLGVMYYGDLENTYSMKPKTKHGRELKKILNRVWNEGSTDMHDGNIMWRKRGKSYQLVITDPVS